jgi:hypothetical protein
VGEPAQRTRLVELVDAELSAVRGVRSVKARRRGLSAGGLVVSPLSECQIAGVTNALGDTWQADLAATRPRQAATAAAAANVRPGR